MSNDEWNKVDPKKGVINFDLILFNANAPDDEVKMVTGYQACNSGNLFYSSVGGFPFEATHWKVAPEEPKLEKDNND